MVGSQCFRVDGKTSLIQRHGLRAAVLQGVKRCEIGGRARHLGMIWAQRLLANLQAALYGRLGLPIALLVSVETAEIVESRSQIGMVWPQCLLLDRQAALEQRLCLGIPPV